MKVKAYAAKNEKGLLEPYEYELGEIGPDDVDIEIENCGLCYSDVHYIDNDFSNNEYPFVPGHEVIGKITAIGSQVKDRHVGQRVGVGFQAGYCKTCECCYNGDHNLCDDRVGVFVGRNGGFADKIRVQDLSAIPIPDALDPRTAGPLMCGGITVFNPFVQYSVKPTDSVCIFGIGGLGHMAIKFANAWGCEVTAITGSESKVEEAKSYGAHKVVIASDIDAIKKLKKSFDYLFFTGNAFEGKWGLFMNTLKPKGRLHFLGLLTDPLNITMFHMLRGQNSVSASPVGGPEAMKKMVEFCARHDIIPEVEFFKMSEINEAIAHLKSGKARYRIVLEN